METKKSKSELEEKYKTAKENTDEKSGLMDKIATEITDLKNEIKSGINDAYNKQVILFLFISYLL